MASEFDYFMPAIDASAPGGTGAAFESSEGYSPTTIAYYREKASQFQNLLWQLDRSASTVRNLLDTGNLDAVAYANLTEKLNEYESRKTLLRTTANAINAAIEAANFFGAQIAPIEKPGGLGFLPVPVAAAAAFAAIAGITVWGVRWIEGAKVVVSDYMRTRELSPEQRLTLEEKRLELQKASEAANASPLSQVATVVKWVAIGAAAYFAWRAYKNR